MNKTIRLLMISDIFLLTGFGLIAPILAIFIKENLTGGSIFAAGFASTLFILTKCIVQLPFSRYVDSHDNKIKWLIIGVFIISSTPFIYIFSKSIDVIYIAQVLHGIGSGLAYPTWLGLWTLNLDKKHESFEWSLYSSLTGLGMALTAAVGAVIAQILGFQYTFALTGLMALAGSFVLLKLENKTQADKEISIVDYHKKTKLGHR